MVTVSMLVQYTVYNWGRCILSPCSSITVDCVKGHVLYHLDTILT